MSVYIEVPLEKSFDADEGTFPAKLESVFKIKGPDNEPHVRLVFALQVPPKDQKLLAAGKSFPLSMKPGTELREFLEHWLGKEWVKSNSGKRLDLESLIDREADLTLAHYHNEKYPKPLVFIQAVNPR
jgi:hypothetical protein